MSAKDLRLYFLVQTAASALKKRADDLLLTSTDLTTAQTAAMAIIASREPLSMRALADALMQRESAMTTMIRRLEAKGLITRTRAKTDKRQWQIALTPLGRAGLTKSRETFAKINAALDEAFSVAEQQSLAEDLTRLRALFGGAAS